MRKAILAAVSAFIFGFVGSESFAECVKIEDTSRVKINRGSEKAFARKGFDRADIFAVLHEVSVPETGGCWSGVSDNFDGQIISAGVLQWNYGQNTLQPLLKNFKRNMGSLLPGFINDLMPTYGRVVFSNRCMARTSQGAHPCAKELLAENGIDRREGLKQEFEALFGHPAMQQVQMDEFMKRMDASLPIYQELFGVQELNPLKFHWVLDSVVHRGGLGNRSKLKENTNRALSRAYSRDENWKAQTFQGILLWYAGHALSPDQGGVKCDWKYNIKTWWRHYQNGDVSDAEFELFVMSWVRERTAQGQGGRWQALAFARRARLALNAGSVAGNALTGSNPYGCSKIENGDISFVWEAIE